MHCGNNYSGTHSPNPGWAGLPSSPDPEHMRDVLSTLSRSKAEIPLLLPVATPRFQTVVRPPTFPLQDNDGWMLAEALRHVNAGRGTSHDGADFYFLKAETHFAPAGETGWMSRLTAPDSMAASPSALPETSDMPVFKLASDGASKTGVGPGRPRVITRQASKRLDNIAGKRPRETVADDAVRDAKRYHREAKRPDHFAEMFPEKLHASLPAVLTSRSAPTATTTAATTATTTSTTTATALSRAMPPIAPRRAAPPWSETHRAPATVFVPAAYSASYGPALLNVTIDKHLLEATLAEDIGVLSFLIDNYHPNLDAALLAAARSGRAKSLRLLLQRGASVHGTDSAGATPLMWAITKGHCDAANVILAHAPGELHRCSNNVGVTNLHYAVHGGSDEMVAMLLQRGADPNAIEHRGYNALHLAMLVTTAYSNGIVAALLKFKVNSKALTTRGETFLLLAAASRIAVIPPGLEAAAREVIDVPDSAGRTPLMWACMVGNGTIGRHLIDLGADQTAKGPGGKTARECAEESGNMDLVAMLD